MKQMKLGGISAIILILIYIIGIVMQATLLNLDVFDHVEDKLVFLSENLGLMVLWISLLYIVFGIFLLFLSISIHDVVAIHNGYLSRVILAFGIVWSSLVIASGMIYNTGLMVAVEENSSEIYSIIEIIHQSIGGNNEIVGALWMLFIVVAGMKYHIFPKWVSIIGLVASIGGVLTMVPSLFEMVIMVFALGQMVWWLGMGIYLLRKKVVYG